MNTYGACDQSYSWQPTATPEVCSGAGNGGCSSLTSCIPSTPVPFTTSCTDCPSQVTVVAPPDGGDGFNYRLPPTFSRPFLPGNGADNRTATEGGRCVQVNECLFDGGACGPYAECDDTSPIDAIAAATPGQFGTYGGFRCACGSGTLEWAGFHVWTDPKAYNHKDATGAVARCTPEPACLTLCDPLAKCFRVESLGPPLLTCSTCPPGFIGSGYLAEGGCRRP